MKSLSRRLALGASALVALACTDPKPTTGSLVVDISGLPAGAMADVRVTGPDAFNQPLTTTTTLEKLAPGEYIVSINPVTHQNALYTAPMTQETHTIGAGNISTSNVAYSLTGGSIDLSITGVPLGMAPNVTLFGPQGFSRSVLTSGIQGGLPAGVYTIRADTVSAATGDRYATGTFTQTVTVQASLTPVAASVSYVVVSGTLDLSVQGLPAPQNPAPVRVTGPGGFEQTTSVSTTLRGLDPGTYTIAAARTGSCPNLYAASQEQQTVEIAASSSAPATVSYAAVPTGASTVNLGVDGAYLVQVTQNYAGDVPRIANRRALLRVFGIANQCEAPTAKVRVTLSSGATYTQDQPTGQASVPVVIDQGVFAASWNFEIPASEMKEGLGYFVEIDPDNQVAETNESDNRFPASGTRSVSVRTMNPTGITIVPVTVTANGLTGDVSGGRLDSLMDLSRRVHPVHSYDVQVHAPYSTSRAPLQSNDQNGSWSALLGEIRALRVAEQSPRLYYGVVRVNYPSGVAGIGYIGEQSLFGDPLNNNQGGGRAALGWDALPSASSVLAHELGHNYGRFHTPCGGPAGVDPQYPKGGFYMNGFAGTFGFDFAENAVRSPQFFSDIMGYCSPQWISDYSYVGMMNWLTDPNRTPTMAAIVASEEPSILVWGRIVNGVPVLEPAFEIVARPALPASGPHRLTALDATGREIASVSFATDRIADLPGDHQDFAFALPKSMLRGRELASLRITTAAGRAASNVQSIAVGADAGVTMSRVGPRSLRLRWNASRYPVVMVRHGATGEVLAFARGGDVTIATPSDELELNYSNRVRSMREVRRIR